MYGANRCCAVSPKLWNQNFYRRCICGFGGYPAGMGDKSALVDSLSDLLSRLADIDESGILPDVIMRDKYDVPRIPWCPPNSPEFRIPG